MRFGGSPDRRMDGRRRPYGVLGVFLVLLGAGLVLDADRTWTGGALIVAGAIGLLREWQTR
jgi:hypothetical protein